MERSVVGQVVVQRGGDSAVIQLESADVLLEKDRLQLLQRLRADVARLDAELRSHAAEFFEDALVGSAAELDAVLASEHREDLLRLAGNELLNALGEALSNAGIGRRRQRASRSL